MPSISLSVIAALVVFVAVQQPAEGQEEPASCPTPPGAAPGTGSPPGYPPAGLSAHPPAYMSPYYHGPQTGYAFPSYHLSRRSEPYEPDGLGEALSRVLAPSAQRKARPLPVALGLPAPRVFFSTRPIRTSNDQATPQILLHEVLQSPNRNSDEMAVDLIRAQPEKRKVASIVSCRKKYLAGLMGALEGRRVRLVRAEPAPSALLRSPPGISRRRGGPAT